MERHPPPKLARFLVWVSTEKEMREDILIAFDEMHHRTACEFGVTYAYVYSTFQGIRSVPYRVPSILLKVLAAIARIGN